MLLNCSPKEWLKPNWSQRWKCMRHKFYFHPCIIDNIFINLIRVGQNTMQVKKTAFFSMCSYIFNQCQWCGSHYSSSLGELSEKKTVLNWESESGAFRVCVYGVLALARWVVWKPNDDKRVGQKSWVALNSRLPLKKTRKTPQVFCSFATLTEKHFTLLESVESSRIHFILNLI